MAEAKELILELALNNQKLISGLKQTDAALGKTQKEAQTTGQKFGELKLGFFAAAAAVAGVVVAFKNLTESAMKQIKAEQQLNAVIKSTGAVAGVTAKQALDLASSLQKVTTFGDDAILGAENILLTFTKIGKEAFPQATEAALNMSQALGQDLKSSSIQLGKALNEPVEGAAALRRVGVQLTDEQEKQIKSFMAVNDIASAQAIILGELEKEFGGSARAAAKGVGVYAQLGNSLDDLKEILGIGILNATIDSTSAMNKFLQSSTAFNIANKAAFAFALVVKAVELNLKILTTPIRAIGIIGQAAFTLISGAVEAVAEKIKPLTDAVGNVANGLKKTIGGAVEKVTGQVGKFDEIIEKTAGKNKVLKDALDQLKNGFIDMGEDGINSAAEFMTALNDLLTKNEMGYEKLISASTGAGQAMAASAKTAAEAWDEFWGAETTKKSVKATQDIINAAAELSSGLSNIFSGIQQNATMELENESIKRTNAIYAESEAQRSILDQQYAAQAISKEAYDAAITALDEQYAKDKTAIDKDTARKKAEMEQKNAITTKAMKITDIILGTASAIVNALSLPFPLNLIQAGLVGAMGGVQLGVAAAAPIPEIPAFAKGGVIDDVMSAPIKGEDGMIAVQRGESVLNRNATAVLGEDAINALNAGRGASNSIVINVNSNNGREVVEVLNDYFRQYGTSMRGQMT